MAQKRLPIEEGIVCVNPDCPHHGKSGTVVKSGKSGKNTIMYCCQYCKKRFSETYGTLFHHKHKDHKLITQVLQSLAEGGTIRGTGRVFEISKDTIITWLVEAGKHCAEVEKMLIGKFNFTQVQVDELWSFIGKKTTHPVALSEKNLKPPS